jgi:hypothetical protein
VEGSGRQQYHHDVINLELHENKNTNLDLSNSRLVGMFG